MRVLIVDDESLIRMDLRDIIESCGHEVVAEGTNGVEAIKLCKEYKPDIVLMDVKMPELDGIEAARQIGFHHEAPVVLLTSYSQQDLINKARESGVYGYLIKPVREEQLVPTLEMALGRYHSDAQLREKMAEYGATVHLIASLDDNAWLLNFRGDDIDFFPLVLDYVIVRKDSVDLYIDDSKLNDRIREEMAKNNVNIHPYNDIYEDAKKIGADEVALIDPMKMNYALYKSLPCKVVEGANPTILMKAIKNAVEIENIKNAELKDSIALTKFIYWVKKNYDKMEITELSASDKLTALRAEQEGYIRDSFEPLQAFGEHAAMMHYAPSKETDVVLKEGGMLLSDTGGGYYEGSTDITRTTVLGHITPELKKYYTAVYRAMQHLSAANFLYGNHGWSLDVLARQPIWDMNKDFQCGTGHGFGYLGSIHEPPTGFRWYIVPSKNEHHQFEPGMVITDEPGIYEEGDFGIRIENNLLTVNGEKNKYGQFMHFETLNFVPIDLDGIDPEELTRSEKEWLNDYHKACYEKVGPYLTDEEREWLKEYTRAI